MKRLLAALLISGLLIGSTASAALAAPGWNPETTKRATPAHACASIPGFLDWAEQAFGVDIEHDFSYAKCVSSIAGGVPNVEFGSPYDQCAFLEQNDFFGSGNYPLVLHGAPGDPFPNLLVTRREECARALYAYHTIEEILIANGVGP